MFKLGDTIIWTTQWGTKYLGQAKALFRDNCGVESVYASCIDLDLAGFHFIAAVNSCTLFVSKRSPPLMIECGGMQPGEEDKWEN